MAHLITVFQYTTDTALRAGASYWSLRFFYLAIGVGAGYFIVGWASNSYSIVGVELTSLTLNKTDLVT